MDNSALNLAHYHNRKADNHLRYRRFDEAIECHQKCSDYLDEALKTTTTSIAIESIKLQKSYHMKQKDLVKVKKAHYEKYKNAIDQQQQKQLIMNAKQEEKEHFDKICNSKTIKSCQLQFDIYKTLEESDSLLEILGRKGSSDSDSLKSLESDLDEIKLNRDDPKAIIELGTPKKHQKDDTVVIEELRSLNHQLQIMVSQLVTQLDESLQEADLLRDKVNDLEKEKKLVKFQKFERPPTKSDTTEADDLSPDVMEAQEFPALAPLELPNFDYESFSSSKIYMENVSK